MSYKPPKDEIPGTTSYLWEACRPREPHENRDYWRVLGKARDKASDAGITDISVEGLTNQLTRAVSQLKEGTDSYADLEEEWDTLDKQHTNLKDHHERLRKELEEIQPQITHLEKQLTFWMDAAMDYGEHLEDCGWMEVLCSARVVNAQEEEYCTCGWYQKRMDLKTDPRFKSSRPPEEIKVKEKKDKFKVDLDI